MDVKFSVGDIVLLPVSILRVQEMMCGKTEYQVELPEGAVMGGITRVNCVPHEVMMPYMDGSPV